MISFDMIFSFDAVAVAYFTPRFAQIRAFVYDAAALLLRRSRAFSRERRQRDSSEKAMLCKGAVVLRAVMRRHMLHAPRAEEMRFSAALMLFFVVSRVPAFLHFTFSSHARSSARRANRSQAPPSAHLQCAPKPWGLSLIDVARARARCQRARYGAFCC